MGFISGDLLIYKQCIDHFSVDDDWELKNVHVGLARTTDQALSIYLVREGSDHFGVKFGFGA